MQGIYKKYQPLNLPNFLPKIGIIIQMQQKCAFIFCFAIFLLFIDCILAL